MSAAELFDAVRWWAVLLFLGAAATPLAFRCLGRLPDRGYAFTKMLGLLVASYLFWLLGSLGFTDNSLGGILLGVLGLLALSAWAYIRLGPAPAEGHGPPSLRHWLSANRRYVLVTELLFAIVFAFWVWVRAQNPTISATEKPMEFAFLNAASRSPGFPPLDPWLSGFAISYYYFGYVMTSLLARLAGVAEPVAFNLGIAWLVAGTAVGAFGLVYNLVAHNDRAVTQDRPYWNRAAVLLGLVAAIALPIAGNMQILLEALHGRGAGSAAFWQWLDVRDVSGPPGGPPRYEGPGWWWWRSSRVIHEYHLSGRSEEGLEPIAEFPGFSFILGDMHPHVLALPFAFLGLAVALSWWLRPGRPDPTAWERAGLAGSLRLLSAYVGWPAVLLTALVLGGLSFLNTWDVLIHLFVVLGAFVLAQWRQAGRWHRRYLSQALLLGVMLAVLAVLLYLPFYLGFRSQAGPPYLLPMLMRPTRLAHFLIIFAMPLWSILILLGTLALRQRLAGWRHGLAAAAGLVGGLALLAFLMGWVLASTPDGAGRLGNLAGELGLVLREQPQADTILLPHQPGAPGPGPFDRLRMAWADTNYLFRRLGWALGAVVALLPSLLAARLAAPGLTLLLAAMVALVVMAWRGRLTRAEEVPAAAGGGPGDSALPFVLLLVATGALLTLGPEFVYLRDNFGVRLNTVFKFYYQAWAMFGVAALVALDALLRRSRAAGWLAAGGYLAMLAVALLFPIYAIRSRAAEYRGPVTAERQRPTLDGLAHVRRYNPEEYAAILWLRQNAAGAPVILEAVGGQYSEYGRISAATGLPTLLGWGGHQGQWRGDTPEPGTREPIIRNIYNEPDWEPVVPFLNRYDVEYVYVGPLERASYNPEGLEKFEQFLEVAYRNQGVVIYRWQPADKGG